MCVRRHPPAGRHPDRPDARGVGHHVRRRQPACRVLLVAPPSRSRDSRYDDDALEGDAFENEDDEDGRRTVSTKRGTTGGGGTERAGGRSTRRRLAADRDRAIGEGGGTKGAEDPKSSKDPNDSQMLQRWHQVPTRFVPSV